MNNKTELFLKIWAFLGPIIGGLIGFVLDIFKRDNFRYADKLRIIYTTLFENLCTCRENTLKGKAFSEFVFFRDFLEKGTIDYLRTEEKPSLTKFLEMRKELPVLERNGGNRDVESKILEIFRAKKRFYELKNSRPMANPRPQITITLAELLLKRFDDLNGTEDVNLSSMMETERFERPYFAEDLSRIIEEIRNEPLKEKEIQDIKLKYDGCLKLLDEMIPIFRRKREKPLSFMEYLLPLKYDHR